MRILNLLFVVLLPTVAIAADAPPKWRKPKVLDPETVLFGHEATVQTASMADKDGEYTFATGHKIKRMLELITNYQLITKDYIKESQNDIEGGFKPGVKATLISGEKINVDMEPGCVEWNFSPKKIADLEKTWEPFFAAMKKTDMVPYVYNAGMFAGGGQFHTGGSSYEENPYVKYPLLLRNVMMYFHKHPSLLYGFAEGYDIGSDSSNWNFHDYDRQRSFLKAVSEFDHWYAKATAAERKGGLIQFIKALERQNNYLIKHDNFMNLQHIAKAAQDGYDKSNQKLTVEYRGFRPLGSAEQVSAVGHMLFFLLDHLAQPDLIVPSQHIWPVDARNAMSPTIIESDWQIVKKEIGVDSEILDSLVRVASRNSDIGYWKSEDRFTREAYSELNRRGANREVVVKLKRGQRLPKTIEYQGYELQPSLAMIDGERYAVAVFSKDRKTLFSRAGELSCREMVAQ